MYVGRACPKGVMLFEGMATMAITEM